MRRLVIAACAAIAVIAATAMAQTASAPTPEEFIDAHRPVMAARVLTKDEQAFSKQLIKQIEKAERPDDQLLEQLRPMASAGDKASMWAMFRGYRKFWYAGPLTTDYETIARSRISKAITALWAMRLWEAGERSKEVAKGIMLCLESKQFATYGEVAGRDCGVTA
jgi:hypothetical protein